MSIVITTPRGTITQTGNQRATLSWNDGFGSERTAQFEDVQKYVDDAVLRHSDPYVPLRTSMLKKSGVLGTVVGSGVVQYIAPYAKAQYYGNAGRGHEGTANGGKRGKRGKYWFERMKANHKEEIRRGAGGKLK